MVEPGAFETVPFLSLQKRRVVRPDGSFDAASVERVRALAGKGPVCVVDLDGLARNKADLDTLRKMGEKGNLWADAGSRFATDAMDVLVAGAERATLRWSRLADEAELREAHEMSDALLLGLEYEGGAFVEGRMGREDRAIALARELSLAVVALDSARPAGAGFDRSLASRLQSSGLERWFLGGVRDGQEARDLEAMGYKGCLVEAERLEGAW